MRVCTNCNQCCVDDETTLCPLCGEGDRGRRLGLPIKD